MRSAGLTLALVAGAALLASTLAACGDGREVAPLKIGVMLVNSETQTETARDRLRAFTLAVKHVNAGGGVFGRPVEFAEGDTLHPEAEARRLIEDEGVRAIVGPSSSADSLLVIEVAAPAGVPVISPSASRPCSRGMRTATSSSARPSPMSPRDPPWRGSRGSGASITWA